MGQNIKLQTLVQIFTK